MWCHGMREKCGVPGERTSQMNNGMEAQIGYKCIKQ